MVRLNYYNVLGISITSSQEEIKKAYRKQAKYWHPDRNSSNEAEERFKKITQAYSVLSNSKLRIEYDQNQSFTRVEKGSKDSDSSYENASETDDEKVFDRKFQAVITWLVQGYTEGQIGKYLKADGLNEDVCTWLIFGKRQLQPTF